VTTVAVIQPYFVPYAGYFRLFTAADVVVMFDCVQFPRRGWVHRNRFALASGELDWLTLPIAKAERDVRIVDLRFAADARERFAAAIRRFPLLAKARLEADPVIERVLDFAGEDVTRYLCDLIRDLTGRLGIECPMPRSSSLGIAPELRGQDRVIAIVKAVGGTRYVNPSGGRALYDAADFHDAGLELRFLAPYEGGADSILTRLLTGPAAAVAADIERETVLLS